MGSTPAFFRVSRAVGTSDFLRAAPSEQQRSAVPTEGLSKAFKCKLDFCPIRKTFLLK